MTSDSVKADINHWPVPLQKKGTLSSTEAAQLTFVSPTSIRTDPAGYFWKCRVILTLRISSGLRPSFLAIYPSPKQFIAFPDTA